MPDDKYWIEELTSTVNARPKLCEPLSVHTSFRIGGPADVFVEIGSMEQLRKLVNFCRTATPFPIPLMVIGMLILGLVTYSSNRDNEKA